ncbi:MAG: peroxiredoxin [Phycisphaeraceae bacterium]|nr:peroxiredoxin [Phycisphaeraceae bacterium]
MLRIGDPAPDFAFSAPDGQPTTLRATVARGPAIVYFYPADFTPLCTKEACMLRDMHTVLAEQGITVIGVSPQGEASHNTFRDQHRLPFSLVADPRLELAKAYKAVGIFGLPIPFGVRRVTYLVSPQLTIADVAAGELSVGAHERLAQRALCGDND